MTGNERSKGYQTGTDACELFRPDSAGRKSINRLHRGGVRSLVKRIVREVYAAAGVPFVKCDHPIVTREFLMGCSEEQVKIQDDADLYLMKQMDAISGLGGGQCGGVQRCAGGEIPPV